MQNFEQERPLEARIEARSLELGKAAKVTADEMMARGFSEGTIAGHFSMLENLNGLINAIRLDKPEEQEQLVKEVTFALQTLVHGMVMGEQADRQAEQTLIAYGRGDLAREVGEALKRANKTGKSGGLETSVSSEGIV